MIFNDLRRVFSKIADFGRFFEKLGLIVSDLGLPDGDGKDLMRELRDRDGLSGIAISGYGMEEDIERSRAAGFSEHLTKPVQFEELQAAISDLVGHFPG